MLASTWVSGILRLLSRLVLRIAIGAVGVRLEVHFAALRAIRVKLQIVQKIFIALVSARLARFSESAKIALIQSHLLGH